MRQTVTMHHVITINVGMLDHKDNIIRAVGKKRTRWKEDLFFTMTLGRQKLSKYSPTGTPSTGMQLGSAHIVNLFWMLRLFRKGDNGIENNPHDETFRTIYYQEVFVKSVQIEFCAKH